MTGFVVGKKYSYGKNFDSAECQLITEGENNYAVLVYDDGSVITQRISSGMGDFQEVKEVVKGKVYPVIFKYSKNTNVSVANLYSEEERQKWIERYMNFEDFRIISSDQVLEYEYEEEV